MAGSAVVSGGFWVDSYFFRVTVGTDTACEIIRDSIFFKILAFFFLRGPPTQEQDQVQKFIVNAFGFGAPWSSPSRFSSTTSQTPSPRPLC